EHRGGEIAGLAHDRAEGDAFQRLGLLADRADQVAPEDLQLDAVHGLFPRRHDAAGFVDARAPARKDDDRRLALLDERRAGNHLAEGQSRAIIDRYRLGEASEMHRPTAPWAGRAGG